MIEQLERVIAELQQIIAQQKTDGHNAPEIARLRHIISEQEQRIAALQTALDNKTLDAAYKQALTLTLANAAYDALLVINDERKIIALNDRAESLFGRTRPIGEHLVDVTGAPELEMMVDDALANEEESYEDQLQIKDRTYRIRTQVIRRDGNFFIGLALQDVTELVRLNRARRDMVSNISHELRTPIANIRLTIDGLFHEQEKPKRKQSIASLRAIAREADSLAHIVQELHDLSMIETGQAIMRMFPSPLREIVDEAVERIGDLTEEKNLSILNGVAENVIVLCDPDHLRRVFINLIHNAVKWSPAGETITVQAVRQEDEVMVTVLDHGPGVPDDQVLRIFERFYQVDASRSGGQGTGLGLAICKHIVEAHGGRIWAEGNSTAQGGHFAFTLLSAE